ncbi:MAG: sterol desaturase family protein [Gammaproteobacteria bacterium]|nr:sterol desaturase family protein [Gammaproteobacteria bacterium]
MDQLVKLAVGLAVLGAVFWLLEKLFPAQRGRPGRRRAGLNTDLLYWFFTPLVTKFITRLSVLALLLLPVALLGETAVRDLAAHGYGPVAGLPAWLQALGAFVLGDFIGYWMHRLFHGRRLWRFHAVHHSSTQVDWLSSVRLHPVNDLLARVAQAAPLLLLGFPATVLAVYVPVISLHAILLHANVPWTFGPLRYALASPAFHRWHHTRERDGQGRNFAGFFPLWDLMFGTFAMPAGRQPEDFGILDGDVPGGFAAQLLYPFRAKVPPAAVRRPPVQHLPEY